MPTNPEYKDPFERMTPAERKRAEAWAAELELTFEMGPAPSFEVGK